MIVLAGVIFGAGYASGCAGAAGAAGGFLLAMMRRQHRPRSGLAGGNNRDSC